MEILKTTFTKKVIACFYSLGGKKLLKVAAFVIFSTSTMVLFEIHEMFKGPFLIELCVFCNLTFDEHVLNLSIKLTEITTLPKTAKFVKAKTTNQGINYCPLTCASCKRSLPYGITDIC